MLGKYQVNAIVAMAENRVIGVDGKLPWHLPEDLKRFSQLTTGHTVLMGRKTFESLPDKYRPLPKRLNLVLSRSAEFKPAGAFVFDSIQKLEEQIVLGDLKLPSSEIWVIGGAQVYELTTPFWDRLYLTRVEGLFAGDAICPEFESKFKLIASQPFNGGVFEEYQNAIV